MPKKSTTKKSRSDKSVVAVDSWGTLQNQV